MRGKRVPNFAEPSQPRRERRSASGVRVLGAACRWLLSPPPDARTFDARKSRLRAWVEGADRTLFHWFDSTRKRLAGDLRGRSMPPAQEEGQPPLVSRLSRDERGATLIFTALFLSVMLTVSAMAVDIGFVYLQNRRLQGLADLAAIAAAGDLDNAHAAALRAVNADNWTDPVEVTVTTGNYTADAKVAPDQRFRPGVLPRNAVRVHLRSTTPIFFGAAILNQNSVDISRAGVATSVQLASFTVGTRLASLEGGVVNGLLSALVGGNISLSVMDYEALAKANIELFRYIDALKTEVGLEAASFDDTLDANVSTVKLIQTLADVVQMTGASRAAAALRDVAKGTTSTLNAVLGDIIELGPYANQDRVSLPGSTSVKVNALDLAKAALELASKDRQVKLDVGASIPGLASLSVWAAIGERPNRTPWFVVTSKGEPVARTAQARVYIHLKVEPGAGVLASLGIVNVEIPLFIELASAEAKLDKINCASKRANRSVSMLTRPGIGHISLASIDRTKLNDFKTPLVEKPATLLAVPLLLSVTGYARVDLGGEIWKSMTFTQADIDQLKARKVATSDLIETTFSSLLGNLEVDVKVLGLGLGLGKGPIESALRTLLTTLAKPLDGLVNKVTGVVGLQLGQAEVTVNGLRCRSGALVL